MKKHLVILFIIFLIFSIIFYGKTGSMLIDFSRESYIPYQITNGQHLTKDIFLIYGFFGYFINSLLYKISLNINMLLIEAHILSFLNVVIIYFILKRFISSKLNVLFGVIFITTIIFSNSTFSFVVPYSYSVLWAYLGIYLSFLLFLQKKYNLLFLTLGFIAVCRIELGIIFTAFYIVYFLIKKIYFIKNIKYIFIFPFLNLVYLFINNITLANIIENYKLIKTMIETDAIKYMYHSQGVFFNFEYFKNSFPKLIMLIIVITASYYLHKKNFKWTSYAIILAFFILNNLNTLFNLVIIPIFILTVYLIKLQKLKEKEILFIIFSALLIMKSLFAINSLGYANFGYIFILVSLYILLSKILDKKYLFMFFILFTVTCNILNFRYYYLNEKTAINTNIGNLYFTKNDSKLITKLNDYIKNNVKENEDILVVPEGQIINLIHKKPWKYYNSTFTPLDFQTFGENNLIKKLEENKTDYIIFYPRNTREYGAQTICYDYGVNFCTYIMDNYNRQAIIEEDYKVLVFKIKEYEK